MSAAYVLINVNMGREGDLKKDLEAVQEITELWAIYGIYDILVRIEADSAGELKDIITEKIRRLEGVKSIITLILV